jgi:type IV secretory pathway TrbD component
MMLAGVVFYGVLAERFAKVSNTFNPSFYYGLVAMSVLMVGTIFILRRSMLSKSEPVLVTKADDKAALLQWLTAHILTFAACEAVALFGVVLRFAGSELSRVIPFYLAGFLLLLYFAPRPPTNAIG